MKGRQVLMLTAGLCVHSSALADCPADLDASGAVDTTDFLDLLAQWGPGGGTADLNDDGAVDTQDFLDLLAAWGPCPPPAPLSAPPTIVVYNRNYPDADGNGENDAFEIAQHYAAVRKLGPQALCGVNLPAAEYATPAELLAARDQIVEHCICGAAPEQVQEDTGCELDNPGAFEAIRDASPITHMVLIRGLPIRLFNVNWPDQGDSDKQGPSFAFYLSYLINHNDDIFNDFSSIQPLPYPITTDSAFGYVPPINPTEHGMLAYGYVEAITKQRTIELIDRTIEAERLGVRGNFLLEDITPFFFDLSSTLDPVCFDYLSSEFIFGDPASSWPWQICRVGTTASSSKGSNPGNIPGEQIGTTVPVAMNAAMLYGRIGGINRFAAFDGFHSMLNWHRSEEDCPELCRYLPTQQEQDDCRAASTDYYQEINTDCVGTAPGFLAYQLSSFAVQYYGLAPKGWGLARSSSAHKSMPRVLSGDAWVDAQFTDDRYARYGAFSHVNPDGSFCDSGPCLAHIAVDLGGDSGALDVFVGDRAWQQTLRLRYRYAASGGTLTARLRYTMDDESNQNSSLESVELTDTAGAWVTHDVPFTVGPIADRSVTKLRVRLWASAEDGVSGFLDLDGIEVIDAVTAQNIFPVEKGSFNHDTGEATVQGDWAANVIDRLGGIACWGTSGHHTSNASATGGRFPGAFFAGRTLGEAIVHANSVGSSGIIYGDPLFRPAAAKIHAAGFTPVYQNDHLGDPAGYDVWSDTHADLDLRVTVLHGTAQVDTTRWELFSCPDLGIGACDGAWTSVLQGVGAVDSEPIGALADYLDVTQDGTVTLKLRVWNEGDEQHDLISYAFFRYWANTLPPCPGDGNSDGAVDEIDENLLLQLWGPKWFCAQACPMRDGFCIADVNQDGVVDLLDWLIVLQNLGPCEDPQICPADVDGNGTVDQADVDLVEQFWSWGAVCPLPYEDCPVDSDTGFCVFDFDQDGDVDDVDHQTLLDNYMGPCPT